MATHSSVLAWRISGMGEPGGLPWGCTKLDTTEATWQQQQQQQQQVAKQCLPLLRPHGLQPARLLWLWDFPGRNTGVGGHFLL